MSRERLQGAVRQYKHNDGSEGFVIAYDEAETEMIVAELEQQLEEAGLALDFSISERDVLLVNNARLREAIEPFAKYAKYNGCTLNNDRAADVLAETKQ